MRNIKAIVFDYGGVISFPPSDTVMEEIAALAGIKPEIFKQLYSKHRKDYDRGKFPVSIFYKNILDESNIKVDKEIINKMGRLDHNSWKEINPETIKLMQDIKNAGFILGILSNMPFDFLEYLCGVSSVYRLPHIAIYSCEAGCIKPEEAIYRLLLSKIKCRAEELVFFDDVKENVDKALEIGIKARLWEDCQKAHKCLEELNIRLQGA